MFAREVSTLLNLMLPCHSSNFMSKTREAEEVHNLPLNESDSQFYVVSTNHTMRVLLLFILNYFVLIEKRSNNLF